MTAMSSQLITPIFVFMRPTVNTDARYQSLKGGSAYPLREIGNYMSTYVVFTLIHLLD